METYTKLQFTNSALTNHILLCRFAIEMQKYIKRTLQSTLIKASKTFPALILTGPRQSGKTTVVKALFDNSHTYLSLDDPDLRVQAVKDPKFFLANFPPPVIIDEVQYAPNLFPYLKIAIDQNRHQNGQFILTGSQLFPLMAGVSESLAGRIAVLNLLPLSLKEMFPRSFNLHELKQTVLSGGFPELFTHPQVNRRLWFSSYVQTYLERDIRQLKQVANLTEFQKFLQLAAASNGQIINLSNFSNDLGLAVNTLKSWFSILEATGQISLIQPFYNNRGKRLIKRPKLYFLDSGLFCYLIGLTQLDQIFTGPLSGSHLESLIVSELYKYFYSRGLSPRIYFWRTSNQQEVDLIIEHEGKIFPLEIKLTAKVSLDLAKSLISFMDLFKIKKGFIVNLSDKVALLNDQIVSLPISKLLDIFN